MYKGIIEKVESNSLAEELQLQAGDAILSINGQVPQDMIDFQFLWSEENIELEIERAGNSFILEFEKDIYEPLGVVFSSATFNGLKTCRNKCLFCFVDQMPLGMRKSLYQKDDDYRLSVLQGSFITLTNLQEEDLTRIKQLHLSPMYVSVHTTDPELRVKLIKNPKAGQLMNILSDLASHEIEFHTQIVLCPGINDGKYLEKSIRDLVSLWPHCRSLAIVPVGVTKYRDKLEQLNIFSQEQAKEIIMTITKLQQQFKENLGYTYIWLSDEFYITAEMELPEIEIYEDFPQLENGIGITRLFRQEFFENEALIPSNISPQRKYYIVTGVSGAKGIKPIIERLNQVNGLEINVKVLTNHFFGSTVTVTGLLTGQDLLMGLKDLEEGAEVLFPKVMLKTYEDRFLDDMTVAEVEEQLKIKLIPVEIDGLNLIKKVLPLKGENQNE